MIRHCVRVKTGLCDIPHITAAKEAKDPLKLLIMDRDEDNIKNFKAYIKMSFPNIKSVYTLSDQKKDILFVFQEIAPELIIADIGFFGAGVIKTMAEASERYPEIKFILYGTINDSGYLQKAAEYGAIDYMYRPVRPAEFKRCMDNAIAFFDRSRAKKRQEERTAEDYRRRIDLFENKFLTALVNGRLASETEIKRGFHYFNMDFTGGFTVFIIRIDRFKKIILTLDESEKHLLIFKICGVANTAMHSLGWKARAFIYEFNCVVCLVGEDRSLNELAAACDDLKEEIYQSVKTRVTLGLGRSYKSAADIRVSYNEADAALRYRFYLGHNTVIPINFADPENRITYRYPAAKEERLVYTAVCGDYNYCESLLSEIFGALKRSGELPEKFIPKVVTDIMISISRYVSEQKLMPESRLTAFFKISDALNLKTPDEAREYLQKALNGFCGRIRELRAENDAALLKRAKAYIRERYTEDAQLSVAAFGLNTTPEHLNALFAADGTTYYDYIGRVRLNESKRLIKETDLSDEQIALKVGYDDVRHFRGLFRQNFGIFPQDFRNTERNRP